MGDAIRIAERALELSREQKERGHEAYALCLLGEVQAHSHPLDTRSALVHYRQAMTVAEELGLRPLQAHTHLGLGKMFRRTGDRQSADTHLAAAIALYRELDMRFWLEKAEANLQGLP
jgi:tetratricopeptide (TPR) repeat protein